MWPEPSPLAFGTAHQGGGRRVHVGVLVPWANMVVEDELACLHPDGVVFHYARLVPAERTTALDERFLDGVCAAIPAALDSLSMVTLDAVLLACTSAGFTCAEASTTGVVSAFDALTTVLGRLGAKRVVLATPYPPAITTRETEAFSHKGVTVVAHASLGRDDEYSGVAPSEIMSLVDGIDSAAVATADALVLSCTGWPTLGVIPALEQSVGIPVVSSNVAMATCAAMCLTAEG